jgi:hypothetical protein
MHRFKIHTLCICTSLLITILMAACNQEKKGPAMPPAGAGKMDMPLQVEGFIVIAKNLAENLEVPGTLQPFEETEIRPEISGKKGRCWPSSSTTICRRSRRSCKYSSKSPKKPWSASKNC